MVRFIDKNRVLINDLSVLNKKMSKEHPLIKVIYDNWKTNFLASLSYAKLKPFPFSLPCTVHKNSKDESAVGVYMNFLLLEKCVLMPSFGDKENDPKAQKVLERAYDRKVIPIEANKLAEKGGIINCITWIS
jgi:agmatine deiminase